MEVKATIGIVEDHDNVRATIKFLLTVHKYNVIIEAKNGEDLFARITESSQIPAICIVDANMPVMDGPQTVLKLKESFPMVKIIAYSNDETKGYLMVRQGADEYLPKHSEAEVLIKCIEKLSKS